MSTAPEEKASEAEQAQPQRAAPAPTGRRELNRISRTRTFLDTAFRVVMDEGFDALTMQRLADETGAAIGAVYRYFPSKGALVAEVQREAIERLGTSYALIRDRSDRVFEQQHLDAAAMGLARLMLFGRFFIATADTYPQELRLLQMLMGESRSLVPPEEGLRVVPSAMRLLDRARVCLDDAMAAGAIDDRDESMARVVTWASAVGGVLQLTRLGIYDPELFDGDRLARELTADMLVGWGATRAAVDAASALVDEIAAVGPLAPPVPFGQA